MDFEIFEENWQGVGDYSGCDNYEHMFDCAENDVQRLLWIVNWIKELEPVTLRLAITALRMQGFVEGADALEKWLDKKPK